MERTIMVANTKTQKRYKITTNAETLGELKQTLAANNIDYADMSFTEGISKTTLTDDAASLPTNVSYKGSTTNNLVILLTNTRKNIASGLDRNKLYDCITKNSLQKAVEDAFGRNFTQVSTSALETFLVNAGVKINAADPKNDTVEEISADDIHEQAAQRKADSVNDAIDGICDLIDDVRDKLDDIIMAVDSLKKYASGNFDDIAEQSDDEIVASCMAAV